MGKFRLFVIAFALNLVWEMIQMREYAGLSGISFGSSAACSAAAIGDSGYILLLYWSGSNITADRTWISRMTPLRLGAIMAVGFLVGVIMERAALFASWWQYAASMPRIPVLSVGLWPVLQLNEGTSGSVLGRYALDHIRPGLKTPSGSDTVGWK